MRTAQKKPRGNGHNAENPLKKGHSGYTEGFQRQGTEKKDIELLLDAAEKGDLRRVKMLIGGGKVGVDSKGNAGETPLMRAAGEGELDIIRYLVSKDADVEAQDILGFTALMKAVNRGSARAVTMLAGLGAELERRETNMGWTAFMLACKKGDSEIMEILLEAGANPHAEGKHGENAISILLNIGNHVLAKKLILEKGVGLSPNYVKCNERAMQGENTGIIRRYKELLK